MQGPNTSDNHEKGGAEDAAAVFHAHGIRKMYTMGALEAELVKGLGEGVEVIRSSCIRGINYRKALVSASER
jgi:hypothetical protein